MGVAFQSFLQSAKLQKLSKQIQFSKRAIAPIFSSKSTKSWCSDENGWTAKSMFFAKGPPWILWGASRAPWGVVGTRVGPCGTLLALGVYQEELTTLLSIHLINCGDLARDLAFSSISWRVTRLLSIDLLNCGDLLRIDRPGYWRVVLFLHWLFKLFQTQSKGNLCSTKVSSEKDKGGA